MVVILNGGFWLDSDTSMMGVDVVPRDDSFEGSVEYIFGVDNCGLMVD